MAAIEPALHSQTRPSINRSESTQGGAHHAPESAHPPALPFDTLSRPASIKTARVDSGLFREAREHQINQHSYADPSNFIVAAVVAISASSLPVIIASGMPDNFQGILNSISSPGNYTSKVVGLALGIAGAVYPFFNTWLTRRDATVSAFDSALTNMESRISEGIRPSDELQQVITNYAEILKSPKAKSLDIARAQTALMALTEYLPLEKHLNHLARIFFVSGAGFPQELHLDGKMSERLCEYATTAIKTQIKKAVCPEDIVEPLGVILAALGRSTRKHIPEEALNRLVGAVLEFSRDCYPKNGYSLLEKCKSIVKKDTLLYHNLLEAGNQYAGEAILPDIQTE